MRPTCSGTGSRCGINIAPRARTLDTFTLSEGNKKVRIRSLEPDPLNRFVVMLIAPATKLVDRFSSTDELLAYVQSLAGRGLADLQAGAFSAVARRLPALTDAPRLPPVDTP